MRKFIVILFAFTSLFSNSQQKWFNALSGVSGVNYTAPAGDPSITVTKNVTFYNGPEWNGRANVKQLESGRWILLYAESESHPDNTGSVINIQISDDKGATWTNKNENSSGVVVGPFAPPAVPGFPGAGAGESWLYVFPSGRIVIHTWRADYDEYNGGTYQWHSDDDGETWVSDGQVVFNGISDVQTQIFATDDDFVYNGTVYAGARVYGPGLLDQNAGIRSILIKNSNNGDVTSWDFVSNITDQEDNPTNEVGLQYTGNNRIIAIGRGTPYGNTYFLESLDMGLTWTSTDITSGPFVVSGRHRIKTRAFLKGQPQNYKDPVLIVSGFVNTEPPNSHPRRSCVWISKDAGVTWSDALWLDVEGFDGGYNDLIYDETTDEYVVYGYYAPTSFTDGYIKEWRFNLTFTEP